MTCERLTTPESPVQMIGCGAALAAERVLLPRISKRITWVCPICQPDTAFANLWDLPAETPRQDAIEIWRGFWNGHDVLCLECGVYAYDRWADPLRPETHRYKTAAERDAWLADAAPADLYDAYVAAEGATYDPTIATPEQDAVDAFEAVRDQIAVWAAGR